MYIVAAKLEKAELNTYVAKMTTWMTSLTMLQQRNLS